jgi:spore coat protein U-like protein
MQHRFILKIKIFFLVLVLALCGLVNINAFAATDIKGTLTFVVYVTNVCKINVLSNLDFGSFNSVPSVEQTAGQIQISCTSQPTNNWTMQLTTSGTGARTLTRGGTSPATLSYTVYRDNLHLTPWLSTYSYSSLAQTVTIPVYGVIPTQTLPAANTTPFTDSIPITLTYY